MSPTMTLTNGDMMSADFIRIIAQDLEHHLDEYDKVSLVFLLCNDALIASEIIMKHVMKSEHCKAMLYNIYQKASIGSVKMFKAKLLEALTLMQNYYLINKLGYGKNDKLILKYISDRHKNQYYVSLARKTLYYICESLSKSELNTLMDLVKEDFESKSSFLHLYDNSNMEFNILVWICNEYINDGLSGRFDMENLMNHLTRMKKLNLAQILESVQEECNKISNEYEYEDFEQADGKSVSICHNITSRNQVEDVINNNIKVYKMDEANVGLCVIINQKKFKNEKCKWGLSHKLETRIGTDIDRDWLNITFTSFGYKVIIYEDLDHQQFEYKMQRLSKIEIKKNHSSFVLCILTHGMKDAIFCSDCVPVEIAKIENWILGDECPALLSKPKLVIIQACQGDKRQIGVDCDSDLDIDGICPPSADLLTFIATVPGYSSIRDPEKGSWFIHTLCKEMLQHGHISSLTDILTSVTDEISKQYTKAKWIMVPQQKSTHRKKLFYPYISEARCDAAMNMLVSHMFNALCMEYLMKRSAEIVFRRRRMSMTH